MKPTILYIAACVLLAGCAFNSTAAVTLEGLKLTGDLGPERASFNLTATARVEGKGGELEVLSGAVALTELNAHRDWQVRAVKGRYVLSFERGGRFPIQLKFDAAVKRSETLKSLYFRVPGGVLQPIVLRGLSADTSFEFAGGARPQRKGDEFVSFVPDDGTVKLSWKEAKPEGEGKLFYSAEMLSQITVSPGLMRQQSWFDFKILQGELNRVVLLMQGAGEVTRVQGEQVLAWNVETVPGSNARRLTVQFNQPQKEQFGLQVQVQTPLGAFPQTIDAMQLRPEGVTRFAGYFRLANEGAVRLEVAQAAGLSQVSPEQFPENDATRTVLRTAGNQRFVYRLSGGEFTLRIQADQILPELGVSQVLAYKLGESEQTIDAEFELDIREAPLRELLLHIPKGYAIAKLTASGLSDYFSHELEGQNDTELRLVYGQPLTGRQLVELRLERNQAPVGGSWELPHVEVAKAKSIRGHIGVSADAGFRLSAERTQGLTEIASAFFPRKLAGLQSAFRLSEPGWEASMRVERLPQTVQADAFHLFSIGEGVAYGSSVLNYMISGAPVSAFKVELSDEYFNVEFTGKDVRNWQKTTNGYLVQLHTPVSGPYTLLATYERPFKAQGDNLGFTGARSLDAQSEQGHTLIISAYQFQVKPTEVSSGLLELEPGEVPAEYRLFFDAPILRAYRYTSRPFNLRLALSPLAQGGSLNQVVDRASLSTHVSKEGQVITDAHYMVKNRGNPHLRLALADGVQLWSATVNDVPVVPVLDGTSNLIPLPQNADPNAVFKIDLQLASRSGQAEHITLQAPVVNAPIMLSEWKLEPDVGQRLVYRRGSLAPLGGILDNSGFAQLARTFTADANLRAITYTLIALALLAASVVLWRWAGRKGVCRFSAQHILGMTLGVLALAVAAIALTNVADALGEHRIYLPSQLTFLAPVQQSGNPTIIDISNLPEQRSVLAVIGTAWPALLAGAVWIYGLLSRRQPRSWSIWLVGWTLLAWAALRSTNGAVVFLMIASAFLLLHVVLPTAKGLLGLPRQPESAPALKSGAAPATAALLVGGLLWLSLAPFVQAAQHAGAPSLEPIQVSNGTKPSVATAEEVLNQVRVEENLAAGTASIHWRARKGDVLPFLLEPAVLTGVSYPSNALNLVPGIVTGQGHRLMAEKDGAFDVVVHYELPVSRNDVESGFVLPVPGGVVNRLRLTAVSLDVDVQSPQAVSVQRETSDTNTLATLTLSPAGEVWVGWKPRSRDVKHEKPVFYAELSQLYVPTAGVIEGAHLVSIRPAQGELSELILDVPTGAAITDVSEYGEAASSKRSPADSLVSLWRFDPDARKLRITLSPAQSHPFRLLVRSQMATGPLPFEHSVGLMSVENAAGQIGLLGIATGNEVQLDSVGASGFSPINLEDFPSELNEKLQSQVTGLTVRRAFRYGDIALVASLKASPVEPDVRVETQDTLSLGEDRVVLAVNATAEITRAGIFRLSFALPEDFDIESLSGSALSHWTESKSDGNRIITLHLNGKTEGQQQFALTLSAPGVKQSPRWLAPQVLFREASKQRGTLLLVPEQGLRLQVAERDGLTQLDPQKSGIRQKGVLAFRVLQAPWNLALEIEQVEPWVQVTSLQHAALNEAQLKVGANLQYQIENTGLKSLRVLLPANAEAVRFKGEEVADFMTVGGVSTNGMQSWEVKLRRRVLGSYLLQVTYQVLLPEHSVEALLRGVQAQDVNLQRGFVTVQSGGRLQVRIDANPEALQLTEWQSIPRVLQQDLQAASANYAYRLVEPAFDLPLKLERHEPARVLPARVTSATFKSVISDAGVMLTHVRLEMFPGDKPDLSLTLPKGAQFWFAFVNQNGVWPSRDQDKLLIPLERPPCDGKAIPVEFFYSCNVGKVDARTLQLELPAPKFDLPLEDLTWRVSVDEKWHFAKPSGSLQFQQEEIVRQTATVDVQGYLQDESTLKMERTKQAEELLAAGNNAIVQGEPQLARRAFQEAYGLSSHDAAFNEDARVQLHNIKLQQALVGLNVRQAASLGDTGALGSKFRDLRGRKEIAYTQQDAKDIIDRNTADDNAAYMRLAERLVQQQDAAVSSATPIRANVPEQGKVLTFKRAVVVEPWAELKLDLHASAVRAAAWGTRCLILLVAMAVLALFARATHTGKA